MKTAFLAAALATTVIAEPIQLIVQGSPKIVFPTEDLPAECADMTIDAQAEIATGDVFLALVTAESFADFQKCAVGLQLDYTQADEKARVCFTAPVDPETQYTFNSGANAACPIKAGAVCKEDNSCQFDVTCKIVDATDATQNYCPFPEKDVKLTKLEINLGASYTDEHVMTAMTTAGMEADKICPEIEDSVQFSWFAGKKADQLISFGEFDADCDTTKFVEAFDKSIDDFNKEQTVKVKISLKVSDAHSKDFSKCWNDKTGFYDTIIENSECKILGNVGSECTENKQCGTGICAEPEPTPDPVTLAEDDVKKVCTFSAAFSTFAVPVIAGIIAIALF